MNGISRFNLIILSALIGLFGVSAYRTALAENAPAESRETFAILPAIRSELQRKHPGARIEILGEINWARGIRPETAAKVTLLSESVKGEAQFSVVGTDSGAEAWVTFAAWMPAQIALRRVQPGERLTKDMFISQEVNVASGSAYEYRGVMVSPEISLESLETRQTVLEGQYLLSTAVTKVPDVRRGETVRIELTSGEITLSTQGIAQEPGYLNGPVHVLTAKTKRELTGSLLSSGVVEVKL